MIVNFHLTLWTVLELDWTLFCLFSSHYLDHIKREKNQKSKFIEISSLWKLTNFVNFNINVIIIICNNYKLYNITKTTLF